MSAFTWIPFYKELASKLMAYRDRQDELIAILKDIKDKGLPVISLNDKANNGNTVPLSAIDPFTFFAAFNRKSTYMNRRATLTVIKERLQVAAEVPTDFEGIPIMHPKMSRFIPWEADRKGEDIPALWAFAKAIVTLAPEAIVPELFNRCLDIECVSVNNLTMGMFWMRPDTYLALSSARFDRLVQYNERHGNRFFEVGHNRIHFRNYVGVIQVGNLTIEILPKADKAPESPAQKQKWQCALVEMLRQSGFIRLASVSDARLRLRSSSLLDIYFESFLAEVEELVHRGLVRKYRKTRGNLPALKGRLLFQEHLSKNLVHRERFFTEHVFYDRNNRFNQVLRVALAVLARVSANPHIAGFARNLSLSFHDIDEITVTEQTFARLPHTRNTEPYRRALQFARLIILNYSPDVRSGREDVLAILFDMNALFERYVFAQLKHAEARQPSHQVTFKAQVSRRFWMADCMRKSLRPDIIAQIGAGSVGERFVLDTKWKIPADGRPADADLHQMHSYNVQFGARRSLLLYPRVSAKLDVEGKFVRADSPLDAFEHACGMLFLELFNGDRLRHDLGDEIITRLNQRA